MPEVGRLWDVCQDVAIAVAMRAVADGVAAIEYDFARELDRYRWIPEYPEFIEGDIDAD